MEEKSVIVHFDLKGAPPKTSYIRAILPILKKWGVTGVLLEWEDSFPYHGSFGYLGNGTYSADDAEEIVQSIKTAGLDIIPLVQIFGHLEFVLKHQVHTALREVPIYPSSICPTHPQSFKLVLDILEQVIMFHGSGIHSFHIGADEVWHMGLCDRCKARLGNGETKEDLFLRFVSQILQELRRKWPDLRYIMWDDMLRSMDPLLFSSFGITSMVEPMVWHYNPAESFSVPPSLWEKYVGFGGVWAAGAFKGASGCCQLLTPSGHHAGNISSWLECINSVKLPVRGFVLTGWSRYDHFASLCETLPCGLPTLGVCLSIMKGEGYTQEVVASVEKELFCLESSKVPAKASAKNESDDRIAILTASCQVFRLTDKLVQVRQAARSLLECELLQTWMNEWQVANKRVNPMQIVPIIGHLNKIAEELSSLESSLKENMSIIFYPPTTEEWIHTYISILRNRLRVVLSTAEQVVSHATTSAAVAMAEADMDY